MTTSQCSLFTQRRRMAQASGRVPVALGQSLFGMKLGLGFDELSSVDKACVGSATAIFRGLANLISFSDTKGILWSVENPASSLLFSPVATCSLHLPEVTYFLLSAMCIPRAEACLAHFLTNISETMHMTISAVCTDAAQMPTICVLCACKLKYRPRRPSAGRAKCKPGLCTGSCRCCFLAGALAKITAHHV